MHSAQEKGVPTSRGGSNTLQTKPNLPHMACILRAVCNTGIICTLQVETLAQ